MGVAGMNDWDDSNESEGMKNMRKQLKKQAEELKAFRAEREQWTQQNRGAVISQALASRGLDAKVAKFYPSDLGTDEESVDKWFNENKDIFGPAQPVSRPSEPETTLSDAEQRGYQAMKDMEAYDARTVQDFKSQLDQIKMDGPHDQQRAEAELLALLKANGVSLTSM
jgi:hypothetical protein